jgi:predicted regulator of Ras-like GTPase activity (Roadblock/LC7/MglB family)
VSADYRSRRFEGEVALSTDIAEQLQELRTIVVGLEDATLIDFEGRVLATTQWDTKDVERVAAMSMALLAMGEQTAIGLRRGGLTEACVRTAKVTLALIPLPVGGLLAARVRLEAPLGLVLLELRRLAEALTPHREEVAPEAEPSPKVSPAAAWMIESMARGLLHLYEVARPPVLIETMLANPYPAFATAAERKEGKEPVAESAGERRWNRARNLYFRLYYHEDSAELMERFELIGSEIEAEYFAACLLLPAEWMRLAVGKTRRVKLLARAFNTPPEKIGNRLAALRLAGPE